MLKKQKFLTLFFSIIAIFAFLANGLAETGQETFTAHLIEEGKLLIQQKKYMRAAHTFAKILMIDPSNKEANECLSLLHNGYYSSRNKTLTELEDRQMTIRGYQKEIRALKQELSINELSTKSDKAKDKKTIHGLTKKVLKLNETLAAKDLLLREKDVALALHRAALNKKSTELAQLQNEVSTIVKTAKAERLRNERIIADLANNVSTLKTDIAQYEVSLKDKITALAQMNSQMVETRKISLKENTRNEHTFQDLTQKIAALNDQVSNQHIALQDKVSSLSAMRQELSESRKSAKEEQSRSEKTIQTLTKQVERLNSEVAQQKIALAEQEHILRHQEDELKDKLAAMARIESEFFNTRRLAQTNQNKSDAIILALQQEVRDLQADLTTQKTFLKDKNEALAKLETELAQNTKLAKAQTQEYDTRILDLTRGIETLNKTVEDRELKIREKTETLAKLQSEFANTQELSSAEKTRNEKIIERLNSEMDALGKELAQKEANLEEKNLALTKIETKFIETKKLAQAEKSRSEQIILRLTKEVEKLTTKIASKEDLLQKNNLAFSKIDANFINLEERFNLARSHWESEKDIFSQEVVALQKEMVAFHNQQASLEGKIALLEQENTTLRDGITQAEQLARHKTIIDEDQLTSLKTAVTRKDIEIARLKTDLAGITQQSDATRELLYQKNQQLALLDVSMHKLQDQFSDEKTVWTSRHKDYSQKIKALDEALTRSNKTIAMINESQQRHVTKIQSHVLHKQKELANVKYHLLNAQSRLASAERNLFKRDHVIDNLESKLAKLENELSQFRTVKGTNEEDYQILIAKYDSTVEYLKDKDSVITDLKQELANARHELASIEKGIEQSHNKDFLVLKKRLKDIRLKIEQQLSAEQQSLEFN